MQNILQWNCRGLRTSASELQALVRQQSPLAVCIQESKLTPESTFSMNGYSVFRKDLSADTIAHGGVILATHHSIPTRKLRLRSPLQAVATRCAFLHREITICSIYCPPGVALPVAELRQLMRELPPPVLILGDFNAHHSAWGCDSTCTRGRLLDSFLDDECLCILNTGSATHFALPSGNTSVLDLSVISPQLMPLFTWRVAEDPMGSDHFPVWLEYREQAVLGIRPPRWNIRKANWDEFETSLEGVYASTPEVAPSVAEFTTTLVNAARASIPRTSSAPRRLPVPWWTDECHSAIRARKRAFRAFNRHPTTDNMVAFKKARARARRVVQDAKRVSWRNYVNQLNRFSPLSQVWSRIKRLSGRYSAPPLPVLEVRGEQVMVPASVATEIARAFANRCSNITDRNFMRIKSQSEAVPVDFSTSEQLSYNHPFTLDELRFAVCKLRSVSEGPDEVHNDLLRHLPLWLCSTEFGSKANFQTPGAKP